MTDVRDLASSDGMMAALFEALPHPLVVTDLHFIVAANASARRLLKYDSPSQLIGRPVLDILHPDTHEAAAHRSELLTRTQGGLSRLPVKLLAADGSTVNVWVDATPVDHGSDRIVIFSYELRA